MNRSASTSTESSKTPRWMLAVIGLGLMGWVISGDVRVVGGPGIGLTETAVFSLGVFNLLVAILRMPWGTALLLLQCSLGMTFAVAEVVLRKTLSYHYFVPYKLEARYLYDLTPGVSREHRILPVNGGTNIYRVNAHGFRGEEFSREPSGKQRVVIYGDSFIHAEFTELENTLAWQLQERLNEQTGSPVEVINAGIAGYGPDQALRRIEDELPWLKPDVLILAVFTGNDFGDLVRNKIYRLGPDGALLENDYRFSDEILLHAELEQVEFIIKRVIRDAALTLLAMLKQENASEFDPVQNIESALQQHLDEYHDLVVDNNNVIKELRSDPYSADISLMSNSPSARYKIDLMSGVLRRIALMAEAANVPLLVVGIPHPMDVLNGSASSGQIDLQRYPDYDAERLTGVLQAISERQGIEHINLLPHFRSVPEPSSLFLKAGDDHWNDAGQSYAADIIAEKLQSSGWLSLADD